MSSNILDVTTGISYMSVSAAISGSNSGDLIEIPAGTYTEDFPKITHNLTLQAVGGLAHLETPGQPTNGQAILVTDANVTVNRLELSGASVGDGNGAGIREESGSLTVLNSYIHDNQDGILTSGVLSGAILTIDHTELSHNGSGSGTTHNLYAGQLDLVHITNSYFTGAVVGHEIKSRALDTIIENNRIQDGPTGTASYSVDLPNGNVATIENNIIEKGPSSQAGSFIPYGGEVSAVASNSSLTITGNTFIDDKQSTPIVFDQASITVGGPIVVPSVSGNTFYGLPGGVDQVVQGLSGTLYANDTFLSLGQEPTLDTSPPFAACYLRGTRIRTDRGERPIEELAVGDLVATLAGGFAPIRWIGRRRYVLSQTEGHDAIRPVLIRADAIADGVPQRELCVSPEHALYIDGALMPARHLTNGVSIVRRGDLHVLEYFHIELTSHGVIFAEGLPAETFVDCDSRQIFDNAHTYTGGGVPPWTFCAPRIEEGELLETIRQRVNARAGMTYDAAPGPLIGKLERATEEYVEGWAQDRSAPERPVRLDIFADGVLAARVVANRHRDDLVAAGLGSGRHAFRVPLGGGAYRVEARRADDGAVLGVLFSR